MTQSLWVPGKLPGLNELIAAAKGAGGTGRAYSRLKRQWTDTIVLLARAAKLRPVGGPCYLRFVWCEENRRRDPDNVAAGGRKLILDSLVTAGVLAGDGWAHVHGWTDSFGAGGAVGVRVEIAPAVVA